MIDFNRFQPKIILVKHVITHLYKLLFKIHKSKLLFFLVISLFFYKDNDFQNLY